MKLAFQDGVLGGAESADGFAAQESGAAGAAMLGSEAGAAAPKSAVEPRDDDRAPESAGR